MTKNSKSLGDLEKAVDDGLGKFLIGNYLLTKVGTEQAKSLANRWQTERIEAQQKVETSRTP